MSHIVTWSNLPNYDEDLPKCPDWAYWQEQERRFWATRGPSISYGVSVVPSLKPIHFLVEVLNLCPPDGWSCKEVLASKESASLAEALEAAAAYRQDLWSYAMRGALK